MPQKIEAIRRASEEIFNDNSPREQKLPRIVAVLEQIYKLGQDSVKKESQ